MLVMMAEKITNSILMRYSGRKIVGMFEDVRTVDRDLKLREQEAFERTHTIAEIRQEYYGDEPIGDERDELFVSQVTAGTTPEDEPAAPVTENVQPDEVMPEEPENEPEENEAQKAMKRELAQYQRRALRSIGKEFKFDSEYIPDYIKEQIEKALPACKTEADVKQVFSSYREIDESRVALTLNVLREALRFKVK